MKITLAKLSAKDLATLVQRIISGSQSGKYPVIEGSSLPTILQASYTDYIKLTPSRSTMEKARGCHGRL